MKNKIILYGANGYTGKLIAQKAKQDNIDITLAGRNESSIVRMAEELGFKSICFSLENVKENPELLSPFDILINCAGPFSLTAETMMKACLHSHCHYLDITGEISIFEMGYDLHQAGKDKGIIICPGVGFDVIPTDCLAARLKEELPDATELTLAFESVGGKLSPGTTKTSIEGIAKGGRIRLNGKIKEVPLGYKSRNLDIGNGIKSFVTIPWGDVATAGFSTGIKNIEVYIPLSKKKIKKLKWLNNFKWVLGIKFIQNYMKNKVDKNIKGPSDTERADSKTFVWGEISNGRKTMMGSFETANGYDVTAEGALSIATYIIQNEIDGGYYTPSMLCGSRWIEDFSNTTSISITKKNND